MRLAVLFVLVSASPVAADGAFCELTPCVPGSVTSRKLTADEKAGGLTCKKGHELGVDSQKRIVFCTTAKPATVDGIPVAADAYTLFHPSGKLYQTHTRATFERTLADGTKVTCGADLIALNDDGTLRYCKLGAKRTGSPRPRIGEGISFHPDGRVSGMTLDEPFTAGTLVLPAGTSAAWDAKGNLIGGYLNAETTAGPLKINYDFRVHPNGKLAMATLTAPAKLVGQDFPAFAKLGFRDDGSLEAAEFVSKRGFMIHGEQWTDTTTMTFDPKGKVLTSHTEHYQSDVRPPKFKN